MSREIGWGFLAGSRGHADLSPCGCVGVGLFCFVKAFPPQQSLDLVSLSFCLDSVSYSVHVSEDYPGMVFSF